MNKIFFNLVIWFSWLHGLLALVTILITVQIFLIWRTLSLIKFQNNWMKSIQEHEFEFRHTTEYKFGIVYMTIIIITNRWIWHTMYYRFWFRLVRCRHEFRQGTLFEVVSNAVRRRVDCLQGLKTKREREREK